MLHLQCKPTELGCGRVLRPHRNRVLWLRHKLDLLAQRGAVRDPAPTLPPFPFSDLGHVSC